MRRPRRDPADNREEREGVDEARNHFETGIAKGTLRIGIPPSETEGDVGQTERGCIGQHMARICKKGERPV